MYYYEENRLSRAERVKRTEEEIVNIIKQHISKFGYSPSVREIAKKASVSSTQTIMTYLRRLRGKGIIDWAPKQQRTIRLIEQEEGLC
ncbi:hypothetical protein [Sporosarcina globispora]|uniref:LexA family protein n=1 Tax=Sporosarcina globispora TaxID=1459 RepID=UPI0006A989BB|nr:hypothetical protein [Sporosarcina globispora]